MFLYDIELEGFRIIGKSYFFGIESCKGKDLVVKYIYFRNLSICFCFGFFYFVIYIVYVDNFFWEGL